jgi:hypothetical protein
MLDAGCSIHQWGPLSLEQPPAPKHCAKIVDGNHGFGTLKLNPIRPSCNDTKKTFIFRKHQQAFRPGLKDGKRGLTATVSSPMAATACLLSHC